MDSLVSDEVLIALVLFGLFVSLWWILQRVLKRWMLRLRVGRHALADFFALLIWVRLFSFYETHFAHIVEMRDGSLERMANLIRPAVVAIRILDAQGKLLSFGSGFFINLRGEVLTNHHVVCCGHRVEIETYDGSVREVVEVLRADREKDLALVSTKGPELFPNEPRYRNFIETLADDLPPQVGSAVYVVGNPLGLKHTISQGIVAASRMEGMVRQLQITAPISSGSSGGPVFDYQGRVVGVITSSASDGQNLNFAVAAYHQIDRPQDPNWITPYSEWAQREVDEGYGGDFETVAEQTRVWTLAEFYREALKTRPNWEMGLLNLARCDVRLHRFKQAMEQLRTVLNLNPHSAEALYLLRGNLSGGAAIPGSN